MIHLFVPYYGEWHSYFQECLDNQTVEFRLFKYDRKENGGGWTSACNMFHREFKRYRGTEDDVVCIMNNDITTDEIGCLYGISGLETDPLIGINAGGLPGQTRDVILPVGTLNLGCSATNTGSVKWTLFYVSIDDGASVEAA